MVHEPGWALLFLAVSSVLAGFMNATVGGGGLVMLPAQIAAAPGAPIPVILGTNKFAALFSNASAAWGFARRYPIDWRFALPAGALGLCTAMLGANLVTLMPPQVLRPLVIVLLAAIALYTYFNKGFGQAPANPSRRRPHRAWGFAGIALLGVYEGFFGPGTGMFIVFLFVRLMGMEFLSAAAHARVVNLCTNFGAYLLFAVVGNVDYVLGIGLAVCSLVGAQLGMRAAFLGGNSRLRVIFLLVVSALLAKLVFDTIQQF